MESEDEDEEESDDDDEVPDLEDAQAEGGESHSRWLLTYRLLTKQTCMQLEHVQNNAL